MKRGDMPQDVQKKKPSKSKEHLEATVFGHRDRLRQRFLETDGEGMPDYEILEILLFAAIPRRDVKPLAKRLIAHFGSFAAVLAAEPDNLAAVKGVSRNTAALLKAVFVSGKRLLKEEIEDAPILSSWQSLLDYCHVAMAHEKKEQFRILFLNRKNRLIRDEVQQTGTIDHTPVYPREVVKRALELSATAIILVHNHPSGDPTPSNADIEMTREIVKALATVDVVVHDHLIISSSGHTSFKAMNLL
ncbi:MAG: JAB domain-containing protein [Micavibrio sp.]|nr:MAG: JAB domain-containing protein [Micavibrio sp.]